MKISKRIINKNIKEITNELVRHAKNRLVELVAINVLIIIFQAIYIFLRRQYLNPLIPLWYTKNWGDYQVASSKYIIIFPLLSTAILVSSLILIAFLNRYYVRYIADVISTFVTISNAFLTYQMLRIFSISTSPFEPLINPKYTLLLPYFLTALVISYFFLPTFIDFMKKIGIITIPGVHKHPSMLLKTPSTRGGGIFFIVLFIILSLLLVGYLPTLISVYIALILLAVLSFIDDYQNTHPSSFFGIVENPFLRLLLLISVVSIPVISGIKFDTIINPLQIIGQADFINFDQYQILPFVVTVIWIVWFINVLSWSNGVDGQFSGIVGIAFIFIALLSLRFTDLTLFNKQVAILSIIGAGIAFGTVKYMWYPSKIMWGFGATAAGLILALFAFLTQTKILTSILIILIPFLDAIVTLLRRLFQKKNPLKGDRGHLHHILISRGWSVSKIALFYWFTTALFGLVSFYTVERFTIQTVLILAGIVASIIILANVKFIKSKDEGITPRE